MAAPEQKEKVYLGFLPKEEIAKCIKNFKKHWLKEKKMKIKKALN